jgi:hypothetical protein
VAEALLPHSSNRFQHGIEFYVAVDGHDSSSGTMEAPFATIDRARIAVREVRKNTPVTVWVRGGTY